MLAKVIFVTIVAFVASCVGVVVGYTPFPGVLESHYWSLALKDLPVLKAAGANVGATFLVLLAAFWSCKGDENVYRNAVFGYSFFLPYFVVWLFLPGIESAPSWAPLNYGVTIAVLFAVQFIASRALRDWFWRLGGRSAV